MNNKIFEDKTIVITGGTGSFGNAFIKKILNIDVKGIRIFSRDEKKQDEMRHFYSNNKLKFYIGDVRDITSLNSVMRNADYVFHAAALKQVPSCEFHPMQAVLTNIVGTENVLTAAINCNVKKIICLSTDKAVYPINAMGISKAMMEKVMVAKSMQLIGANSVICGTRYGNVMASRGSVIPHFVKQVMQNEPITITDPQMTRFMMTLSDAIDLVLFAFANGGNGEIFVQKSPAATVEVLAHSILELMGKDNHPVSIMGARHGEKLHETLLSSEEFAHAIDLGDYYKIEPDTRDLNYKNFIENGAVSITEAIHRDGYTSENTKQLNLKEMKNLLQKLGPIEKIDLS
jgi:UDP-N-acetylglucosamine 4,6-dehydratase